MPEDWPPSDLPFRAAWNEVPSGSVRVEGWGLALRFRAGQRLIEAQQGEDRQAGRILLIDDSVFLNEE